MIWALVVLATLIVLVSLDVRRIQRRARGGPLHEADVRLASRPAGHVDIVGGGFRVP